MDGEGKQPDDPLAFIRNCVLEKKVLWSYHLNMRMSERHITRQQILDAVDSLEIIESYPQDKYLPSYLLYAKSTEGVFHILFATDCDGNNVRVITAYRPAMGEWNDHFRTRRQQ